MVVIVGLAVVLLARPHRISTPVRITAVALVVLALLDLSWDLGVIPMLRIRS